MDTTVTRLVIDDLALEAYDLRVENRTLRERIASLEEDVAIAMAMAREGIHQQAALLTECANLRRQLAHLRDEFRVQRDQLRGIHSVRARAAA